MLSNRTQLGKPGEVTSGSKLYIAVVWCFVPILPLAMTLESQGESHQAQKFILLLYDVLYHTFPLLSPKMSPLPQFWVLRKCKNTVGKLKACVIKKQRPWKAIGSHIRLKKLYCCCRMVFTIVDPCFHQKWPHYVNFGSIENVKIRLESWKHVLSKSKDLGKPQEVTSGSKSYIAFVRWFLP